MVIHLSIDKDIYYPGETIRLFFSGISNYPFGIITNYKLLNGDRLIPPDIKTEAVCNVIKEKKEARFIYYTLPNDLKPSKFYSIQAQFCPPTYKNMPQQTTSRNFEIKESNSINN